MGVVKAGVNCANMIYVQRGDVERHTYCKWPYAYRVYCVYRCGLIGLAATNRACLFNEMVCLDGFGENFSNN